MPHKTLKNLGGFGVGVVVSGANLDARPVLTLVVSDLTDELRQAIDRQAWARIKLTTLADFSRPLFAGIELNVINPVLPVFCFRLYGLGESLFCFFNKFFVSHSERLQLRESASSRRALLAHPAL